MSFETQYLGSYPSSKSSKGGIKFSTDQQQQPDQVATET